MRLVKSFMARFSEIPSAAKLVAVFSLIFIFIGFRGGNKNSFTEIPVVEEVHAEEGLPVAGDEKKDLTEYNALVKEVKEREREREKVLEALIESLKEKEKKNELKKKELDLKEENLKSVRRDIEERLQALSLLKIEVEGMVDKQEAENDANITKLAKVYESAPPEQAGALLSTIDTDIAAKILLKMNSRKAGAVWGFVDPKKAALISQKLAVYNAGKI